MIQAFSISSNPSVIKMSILMKSYYRTPGTGWCDGHGKDKQYNQWVMELGRWEVEDRINANQGKGKLMLNDE